MRNIFIFLLILRPLSILAQEVNFTTNLDKAQKQAAKEKKLIFIDFYTEWCKPCKMMDEEVFAEGEIADRMNAFFINVKINAERDKYTAEKYGITSFPTSVFVDSMGKTLHRFSGYSSGPTIAMDSSGKMRRLPPDKERDGAYYFWQRLEPALATTNAGAYFIVLKSDYGKGRRDAAFLKDYCRLRQLVGLKNEEIVDKLIETMPADSQTVYAPIFIQAVRTFGGKGFNYVVERKADKRFMQKAKAVVRLNFLDAVTKKDKKKLAKVLEANKLIYEDPSVSEAENVKLEADYYFQTNNADRYHETVLAYLTKHSTDTAAIFMQKILEFGDFYFDNIKNKKHLNAIEQQLTAINSSRSNPQLMKTHAKIVYRLEQNDRAVQMLEKAIESVESVENKADFTDILQKMKDKKL